MKIIRILLIACIIAGFFVSLDQGIKSPEIAYAVPGYSTVNITASHTRITVGGSPWLTWPVILAYNQSPNTSSSNTAQSAISAKEGNPDLFTLAIGFVGFDFDLIPADSEIISYRIVMPGAESEYSGDVNGYLENMLWGYFLVNNLDTSITWADWQYIQTSMRATECARYIDWSHGSGSAEYLNVNPEYVDILDDWTDSNNVLWLAFAPLNFTASVPPWAGTDGTGDNTDLYMNPEYSASMYLEVTYLADVSGFERVPIAQPSNDSFTGVASGNETADNITWRSPRCLYASDLYGIVRINGDPGEVLSLGTITDSSVSSTPVSVTIGDSGHYDWRFSLPSSPAFFRVLEYNNGISSRWGRVEDSPNASIQWLHTYAYDTEYPQYDNPFSTYRFKENDIGTYYWKVNAETADFPDTDFKLLLTDFITIWESNFDDLNDYYYETGDSTYDSLAWNSYVMLSPNITSTSFNDRSSLVINMGKNYGYAYSGYWNAVIEYNDVVVCDSHTAYFYIQPTDLGVAVDATMSAENMDAVFTVGERTKLPEYLTDGLMQVINDSGEVYSVSDFTVGLGSNHVALLPITEEGSYQLRITCSSDTYPDYEYIYDWPFYTREGDIEEGTPATDDTDVKKTISDWLSNWGADNELGRWLIIIIVCVIIFAVGVYYREKGVGIGASVLIVLIVVGAMLLGWINAWFIILGALFVGVLVYNQIRKKTQET